MFEHICLSILKPCPRLIVSICRVEGSPLPAGILYDPPDMPSVTDHPLAHEYLPGVSPPVSTESIDSVEHSSGVDSPLHRSGDLNNTVPSGYSPMG